MNSASPYAVEITADAAGQRRRWSVVAGVALSLALHAVLIFGYRVGVPRPAAVKAGAAEPLTVWIRPLPIPLPAVAAIQEPKKPPADSARVRKHERERETARAPVDASIAAGRRTPAQTPAQAITLPARDQPADLPQPAAPKFDMEAARRTARAVASDPDPKRAPGTLAAQLDQHPLYEKSEETQLARDIGSAKRRDCKDGVPGGLLAPLLLLMDKKDSGCKW
ncbi:hypothetical protein [Rugamonas sp.]|uniref:hypothetical protein n=1 Tax=Rugamonas sp. TaxID=1926287 RepID=UPI0025F71DFD|nr:hypothetical protein [Rugamonas sp.]